MIYSEVFEQEKISLTVFINNKSMKFNKYLKISTGENYNGIKS